MSRRSWKGSSEASGGTSRSRRRPARSSGEPETGPGALCQADRRLGGSRGYASRPRGALGPAVRRVGWPFVAQPVVAAELGDLHAGGAASRLVFTPRLVPAKSGALGFWLRVLAARP